MDSKQNDIDKFIEAKKTTNNLETLDHVREWITEEGTRELELAVDAKMKIWLEKYPNIEADDMQWLRNGGYNKYDSHGARKALILYVTKDAQVGATRFLKSNIMAQRAEKLIPEDTVPLFELDMDLFLPFEMTQGFAYGIPALVKYNKFVWCEGKYTREE